ncbi:MAG TPA: MFS transporter [Planctomycetaceae bacterium]|nr:MFS transporter [Planctomycetaceae bacterium]
MSKSSKASLLVIFVTVFIDLLGFGIVLPLLPLYGEYFKPAGWQLGLLMASFSAMQFIFAPIWGRISDRIGRRPVLIIGLAGSVVFYALFGYVSSVEREHLLLGLSPLAWLFITRIGQGIAGATISTAQAYIADVTGPTERARGMALIGAAFGIGFTFGPLLGASFVGSQAGGPTALVQPEIAVEFGLTEAERERVAQVLRDYHDKIASLGLAASQHVRDQLRSDRNRKILDGLTAEQRLHWSANLSKPPSGAPGYLASVLSALALLAAIFMLPESLRPDSAAAERHWLDMSSVRKAVGRPVIGLILLTMFISILAFGQFETSMSLLVREHFELSLRRVFYVFAYIGITLTISQGVLVRRLVPRLGEFKMIFIGDLLIGLGMLLTAVATFRESLTLLLWVVPLVVIGFSFMTPSLQSLLSRHTPASDQGGILGLGQGISALSRILGPMIAITLFKTNATYPYWIGAGMMVIGLICALGLRGNPDTQAT